MFWSFLHSSSQLDQALEKEGCTLQDVLDKEDVVTEFRNNNMKLVNLILRPDNLNKLFEYVLTPRSDFSSSCRNKEINRYPGVSAEILSSDIAAINDLLASDRQYLDRLFDFLRQDGPIDCICANYVLKIFDSLITRKGELMFQFFTEEINIMDVFIQHLDTPAIAELFYHLLRRTNPPQYRKRLILWLHEHDFISILLARLNTIQDEDYVICLLEALNCLLVLWRFQCNNEFQNNSSSSDVNVNMNMNESTEALPTIMTSTSDEGDIQQQQEDEAAAEEKANASKEDIHAMPHYLLDKLESVEILTMIFHNLFHDKVPSVVVSHSLQFLQTILDKRKSNDILHLVCVPLEENISARPQAIRNALQVVGSFIPYFADILNSPPEQSTTSTTLVAVGPCRLQVIACIEVALHWVGQVMPTSTPPPPPPPSIPPPPPSISSLPLLTTTTNTDNMMMMMMNTVVAGNSSTPMEIEVDDVFVGAVAAHNVLRIITELFFAFPWNSFLHKLLEDMCNTICRTQNKFQPLLRQLICSNHLPEQIIDAWTDKEDHFKVHKTYPCGYMGHLRNIANIVKSSVFTPDSFVYAEMDEELKSKWEIFATSTLQESNERNAINFQAFNPYGSISEEDDDNDFQLQLELPSENNANMWLEYKNQEMTSPMIDNFGMTHDDVLEPSGTMDFFNPTKPFDIFLNLSSEEDTPNANMFEQACNEEIRQFDDPIASSQSVNDDLILNTTTAYGGQIQNDNDEEEEEEEEENVVENDDEDEEEEDEEEDQQQQRHQQGQEELFLPIGSSRIQMVNNKYQKIKQKNIPERKILSFSNRSSHGNAVVHATATGGTSPSSGSTPPPPPPPSSAAAAAVAVGGRWNKTSRQRLAMDLSSPTTQELDLLSRTDLSLSASLDFDDDDEEEEQWINRDDATLSSGNSVSVMNHVPNHPNNNQDDKTLDVIPFGEEIIQSDLDGTTELSILDFGGDFVGAHENVFEYKISSGGALLKDDGDDDNVLQVLDVNEISIDVPFNSPRESNKQNGINNHHEEIVGENKKAAAFQERVIYIQRTANKTRKDVPVGDSGIITVTQQQETHSDRASSYSVTQSSDE